MPGTENAGSPVDSGATGAQAPAAITANATDVEILVDGVEILDGTRYILRGTIVAAAAAGRASIAETGQKVSLVPWFPGGAPDLSRPADKRLLDLSAAVPGAKIRCRIALDTKGAWRIISAG